MKIRHDPPFLSSLLFTIVFVWIARWVWPDVLLRWGWKTGHYVNADLHEVFWLQSEMAILSLAIILIGLIVVWTGYLKKVRWTWFIMFAIVFGCAPILIFRDLALMPRNFFMPASDWLRLLADAAQGEPLARLMVESILLFLFMVIAVFLPVKSFFFSPRAPITRPQP